MNGKNYYRILGVDKDAAPDQIKKAYRKLAKSCHPDTHPGDPAAEEKFKEVSEAYEILGDEKKRRQYDQMQAAFSQGFRPGGFDFSGSGVNFEDLFGGAPGGGKAGGYTYADLGGLGGLGDIFSQFMDLGGHIRQERAHVPERGHDISAQVTLPLEKALKGGKVKLTVKRHETCPSCRGSGAAAGSRPQVCPECGGTGRVVIPQGNIAVARPCPRCYGRGELISKPCPECSGTGSVQATRKFSVKVPAGVRDRQVIRLSGQGDPGTAGGPPGDIIIHVLLLPDSRYRRTGDNLRTSVSIDFPTAVLGGKVPVPTPAGPVTVTVPPGTQPGTVLRLKGRGAPIPGGTGRGDLLVAVNVTVPKHPTPEQKEMLDKLRVRSS